MFWYWGTLQPFSLFLIKPLGKLNLYYVHENSSKPVIFLPIALHHFASYFDSISFCAVEFVYLLTVNWQRLAITNNVETYAEFVSKIYTPLVHLNKPERQPSRMSFNGNQLHQNFRGIRVVCVCFIFLVSYEIFISSWQKCLYSKSKYRKTLAIDRVERWKKCNWSLAQTIEYMQPKRNRNTSSRNIAIKECRKTIETRMFTKITIHFSKFYPG